MVNPTSQKTLTLQLSLKSSATLSPNTTRPHAHITHRQTDILKLLYYFRYLDRIQIQSMMDHKDKRAIIAWLGNLRDKKYVEWIYDQSKDGRTKPAIYYLTTAGIRTLRTRPDTNLAAVHRLYGSAHRSSTYIARCLFIASVALKLRAANNDQQQFAYATSAAYLSDSNGPTIMSEAVIRPDLLVRQATQPEQTYFIEYVPSTLPSYRLRTKLNDYLDFTDRSDWPTGEPVPQLLLITESKAQVRPIIKRVRSLLSLHKSALTMTVKITSANQVSQDGVFAPIWYEIETRQCD